MISWYLPFLRSRLSVSKVYFWIAAFVADSAAVNCNGIKTRLANGVCTFRKLLKGWGERGRGQLTPTLVFPKNVTSRERAKPWFFVTFNIIIRCTFPKNVIEITQVDEKIWRFSPSILFSSTFRMFWHFLVIKKLMTSENKKWCQPFFTSNLL